ncbi:MAG: ABC transporter ATP-binding protein, partial [Deltaproteobacteria bacterium]
MLDVSKLNITFGHGAEVNHALKDISFSVKRGESFGLVGESGSGKSTVLNCISGLLNHWIGSVEIDGEMVGSKRDLAFYRKVQLVFQDPYGSL